MKTVMKKIFSLMMVAVLLVSAVPFAASADEVTATLCLITERGGAVIDSAEITVDTGDVLGSVTAEANARWGAQYTFEAGSTEIKDGNRVFARMTPKQTDPCAGGHTAGAAASCTAAQTCTVCGTELAPKTAHTPGAAATCSAAQTCTACGTELAPKAAHTPGAAATCTAAQKCSVCGETIVPALGHTWQAATCTVPKTCSVCGATEGAANGHTLDSNKVCTACGYCDYCKVYTNTTVHPATCPNSATYQTTCPKCNTTYVTTNGHPDCEVCDGCHATADCPYCAVCWKNGDQVKTHNASVHCSECNTVNGHTSTCSKYEYPDTGSHNLKVWARIWIHETEHKTVLLDTISNLSGNAKIYQVIAANADRLESKFPSGYHGIHWYDTVYYKNSENKYKAVDTSHTVGDEDDVYINLYSAEKLVVVNVHTRKSFSYDMSVRVEGFRVGDTVTYNDVLAAVKEYFNVSSMSIYTYDEMQNLIEGRNANKTENFIVTDGDNRYEVYIQGSRKGSSSYTYTADSTNPKTGDMIFAPAIVMGASVTCLAVLFYLNKKRAY